MFPERQGRSSPLGAMVAGCADFLSMSAPSRDTKGLLVQDEGKAACALCSELAAPWWNATAELSKGTNRVYQESASLAAL